MVPRGRLRARIDRLDAQRAAHGGKKPAARRYNGEIATFMFAADGMLRSVSLLGQPATVTEDTRVLRAHAIDLSFEASRMVSAVAKGQVHIDADKSRAESDERSSRSLRRETSRPWSSLTR